MSRSKQGNIGVDENENDPHLRWAKAIMVYLKFIGCTKRKKRIHHKSAQYDNECKIPNFKAFRRNLVSHKNQ